MTEHTVKEEGGGVCKVKLHQRVHKRKVHFWGEKKRKKTLSSLEKESLMRLRAVSGGWRMEDREEKEKGNTGQGIGLQSAHSLPFYSACSGQSSDHLQPFPSPSFSPSTDHCCCRPSSIHCTTVHWVTWLLSQVMHGKNGKRKKRDRRRGRKK